MKFLRLTLLIVIFASLSCLEAKKKPVDYGPENKPQEVFSALEAPTKDYSALTMQAGDRINWETYFFVRNSSEQRIPRGSNYNSVTERKPNGDKLDFKIWVSVTKPDENGNPKTNEKEFLYSVVNPNVTPESQMSLFNVKLFNKEQLAAGTRVTFHNLKVEQKNQKLPDTLKDKSVCAKWENCEMPATVVSFDTVAWNDDGPDRIEWLYILTPHLPFVSTLHNELEDLPANLHTCLTKQIEEQGKKYIVTFCTSVTDFAFGKTE